jgi:PAS domain S-box-containing protein
VDQSPVNLSENLRTRQQESDLLLNLYRGLIESADLASGLRAALEIVCQFTGWAAGAAWLPNQDSSRLEFAAASHVNDPRVSEFIAACAQQTFAPNLGMPGRVWRSRRPEWSRDLGSESSDSFPLAPLAIRGGLSAALCVPILHENHADGVLMFHAREAKDADDRFVQVVSRIATQLGFALHHKRAEDELGRLAEERLEERARQQAAVAEIGRLALSNRNLATLMDETAARVAETLGVEFCKILELLPDGSGLRLRAGVGWRDGLVGHATVQGGSGSQAGYTLSTGAPVVVEDLNTEKRFSGPPLLVEHGVVSGMSVVIPGRELPFGVLGAHTGKRRTFSAEDIHFLEAVAHILSEAIERTRREAAIERSESWLRNLIATTQDAVVAIDRRGRIVLFNSSAERIFGYRAEEIIGEKVNRLMAEPYASEHDEYIARYERTGEARAIGRIRTVTAKRQDGALFPIELSATEIAVDQETHYAAFIRDISEKTRLQEKLLESERLAAIGNTAAKIGHEIANPLNGIYLTLQLIEQRLLRRPEPDEGSLSNVTRVKKEVARLNQLLQEFRTLARQQSYDFRPMHLPGLIGDVVDLQQPLLESQGIVVERKIPVDVPPLRVDEDKFKQALLNLLKNAAEAMPGGGVLTIAVTRQNEDVVIEVADTGVGIVPGTDVFAPFVTTKKEGTGLGLLIVRQIVAAHGGRISYESQPGKGTTFRLTLPLS